MCPRHRRTNVSHTSDAPDTADSLEVDVLPRFASFATSAAFMFVVLQTLVVAGQSGATRLQEGVTSYATSISAGDPHTTGGTAAHSPSAWTPTAFVFLRCPGGYDIRSAEPDWIAPFIALLLGADFGKQCHPWPWCDSVFTRLEPQVQRSE